MIRKVAAGIILIMTVFLNAAPLASALPTRAMPPSVLASSIASQCKHSFLGLEPWYSYLPDDDFGKTNTSSSPVTYVNENGNSVTVQPGNNYPGSKCDITNFNFKGGDIASVLLAVTDDLLRIAGLVAFGFVVTSGVNFITSEGNPDKATAARNGLINALIGIAIATTAIVFVNFIGNNIS